MDHLILHALPETDMSFSSSRRNALDESKPLEHRASHARSCAMLVAQKWNVTRGDVIEKIHGMCGIDLHSPTSSFDLEHAMKYLELIRANGI